MENGGHLLLRAAFGDVEQFCEAVRLWDLEFRPLAAGEGAGPVAELVQMRFGEIDFGASRLRAPLDQTGAPPAGRHTLVLLGGRVGALWWRGQTVSADDVLVFAEGTELACFSGPEFLNLCLSVSEDYVTALAEAARAPLPPMRRRPEVFRPGPALLATARRVLLAARSAPGAATQVAVRDVTDRLVLSWLSQGGIRRRDRPDTRAQRGVARCLDLLDASPFQPIPVTELCRVAALSRRSLEQAFHDRFGVGPAALMKARRLAGARRALRVATVGEVRVGDVMTQFGFSHVGQFARDYRGAFGESPSQTLAGGSVE